ncbi:MAG: DUF342 domain-containing protein [Lachnospiraceae bacterium]|nr:DUF342 domain-containing protein [Lachnospiraceae bacterium]
MANEQKKENENKNPIIIEISDDKMEAYITLTTPTGNMPAYGQMEVNGALDKAGVKGGINKMLLNDMLFNQIYDERTLIATGKPCVDGIDGYFEYFFHQKDAKSGKPRILDDGSVDYTSVNTVGTVSEGDLIAIYTPAVPGKYGYNVTGDMLKPKPAKGYPVPNLVGCRYEEESYSYYALIDGKVEATLSKIEVTGQLDINRNINVAYGSVHFIGDVNIYGDVDSGVEITASGNVTISGTVQGSSVSAGGDITVRGGVMGDEKVKIICGGNLETRFLQYSNVVVGGDIIVKSILDCEVYCGGMIRVEDNNGIISGGDIYCVRAIDGKVFGNSRKVKTRLAIGKNNESLSRKVEYPKLIEELEIKLKAVNAREIQLSREAKTDHSKANMLHIVRQNKANILTQKKQLEGLFYAIDSLYGPEEVREYIFGRHFYPGVSVCIDMREKTINEELIRVKFKCRDEKISYVMEDMDEQ